MRKVITICSLIACVYIGALLITLQLSLNELNESIASLQSDVTELENQLKN